MNYMLTIDQRFLTPEVVRKITNLSEKVIQELMQDGHFPSSVEIDGNTVFDCQEVLNYIADEIYEENNKQINDEFFVSNLKSNTHSILDSIEYSKVID